MKKRCIALFTILMMVISLVGAPLQIYGESENVVIDIVHTNDIHGRSSNDKKIIGFEKMKTWIQQIQPDFIVDAGDTFHGQAFATLEKGESIASLLKEVGYDAMTPGNHDWNYGKDQLNVLQNLADLKILGANIKQDGEPFFGNDGYIIKYVDGVKVGLFGIFDQDIKGDTAPRNIEGLTFDNDAETANEMAAMLREQDCDIVIALSHQAYLEDFVKKTKGIDLLIAGHEHIALNAQYPDQEGKMVNVVETGSYLEKAGHVAITYGKENKQIEKIEESYLTAEQATTIDSDVGVSSLLQTITQRQASKLQESVGSTSVDLDGRWETLRAFETTLGRVVTNAYLHETGADVAFENAGGIRNGKVIQSGNVLYKDILDIAPFGNYIVTKEIQGKALVSILEDSIEIGIQNKKAYDQWVATGSYDTRWPDNSGSYLQVAGVEVTYDTTKTKGERIESILIKGKVLDMEEMYTIATNNFVALGSSYPQLANIPELHQYSACDEALINYFALGNETIAQAANKKTMIQKEVIENVPEEKPETTPETLPKDSVDTGDDTCIFGWIGALGISCVLIAFGNIVRQRVH